MDDIAELVTRARTAETRDQRVDAFGQLVRRFQDMACGYAYSILGDFHLAEDAAQEAFVAAFRQLGDLRQPEAFAGWLRRIVWSACGRFTRRTQLPGISLDAAAVTPSASDQPAEALEKAEMRDTVLRAINELPSPEREATTLFYINGYSQQEVADFLEVPVTTVKNRLSASRGRLKERMLDMVKDTLHANAPGERFNQNVIEELIERPRPLEIPGHPSRQVWDAIRSAMSDYEVIDAGNEVEDESTAKAAEDHAWEDYAYRRSDGRALRFQMTSVMMTALAGRRSPVRLIVAGRVFRPDTGGRRAKVFHQVDGVCIQLGLDVAAFKATCEQVLLAAVPDAEIRWAEHDTNLVTPGFEATVIKRGRELEVLGGGMLLPKTLLNKGFDPKAVAGFAWGLGLDRLAMLRFDIDDIHELWQPPYVP